MKKTKIYGILAGSMMALAMISFKAKAQIIESEWGDLGYSQSSPEVEELPTA